MFWVVYMQKKPTIGIMIPELFDPYQVKIWKGISYRIEELGLRQICFVGGAFNYNENKHKFRNKLYNLVTTEQLDMLLFFSGPLTVSSGPQGITDFLKTLDNIPSVSIGIDIPGMSSVIVDNESGMYDLVDHMIKVHNCKNIGFIKGPDSNEEALIRHRAYKKALEDNNLKYNPNIIIEGEFHPDDGIRAVKELIQNKPANQAEIDCLLASDDSTILSAINELSKIGIKCPEDILVGGFDDIEMSEYNSPSLTTVRQPLFDLGRKAVEEVYNLFKKITKPGIISIHTKLVVRDSCGCSLIDNSLKKNNATNITLDKMYQHKREKYNRDGDSHTLLLNAIYSAIKENSMNKVDKVIEGILLKSNIKGISASYWNNIIFQILSDFKSAMLNEQEAKGLDDLDRRISIVLYKIQAKVWAQNSLRYDTFFEELQRFDDNILLAFDKASLTSTLDMGLPYFDVNFLLIALFNEDRKTVKVYYCQTYKNVEGLTYRSSNLYPKEIQSSLSSLSLTVLPIMENQVPIGFVLTSMGTFNTKTIEFLAEKLSGALVRIKLVDKINQHSEELTRVVEERTAQLKEANNRLKELSFKDQLSGLYNRHFLKNIVIPDTRRFQCTMVYNHDKNERRSIDYDSYGLLLIDFDYFKSINDTYGHHAGDLVIKQVSLLLMDSVRENDYVIRFGGEEFLVILKNFKSEFLCSKVEEIRSKVEEYSFEIDQDQPIKRTCSIGCVTFPFSFDFPSLMDFYETVSLADLALYYAKENGRNRAAYIRLNKNMSLDALELAEAIRKPEESLEKGIFTINCFE